MNHECNCGDCQTQQTIAGPGMAQPKMDPEYHKEAMVEDRSPMEKILVELNRCTDNWGCVLDQLGQKIEPILGPSYPTPDESNDKTLKEQSQVINEIRNQLERMYLLQQRAWSLIERVEL